MAEPIGKSQGFDWRAKARKNLWRKPPERLNRVPTATLLIGTVFYCGLSPFASGTVGSLAAVVIYYFWHGIQNPIVLAFACFVVLVAGIWSGGKIERILEIQDPGIVVIDEVLGQWIALFTIRYAGDLRYILFAFIFFRLFDGIKPPPARRFERMEGGVGIMLDDVVAGIYALIATHLVMLLF